MLETYAQLAEFEDALGVANAEFDEACTRLTAARDGRSDETEEDARARWHRCSDAQDEAFAAWKREWYRLGRPLDWRDS